MRVLNRLGDEQLDTRPTQGATASARRSARSAVTFGTSIPQSSSYKAEAAASTISGVISISSPFSIGLSRALASVMVFSVCQACGNFKLRHYRRGWFGRDGAPADVPLTFECELSYIFDPAVWGQGYATEAACCVRDYARDGLGLAYIVSAILPTNGRSRQVAERAGARADGQMEVIGLTWDRYVWPLAGPLAGHTKPYTLATAAPPP